MSLPDITNRADLLGAASENQTHSADDIDGVGDDFDLSSAQEEDLSGSLPRTGTDDQDLTRLPLWVWAAGPRTAEQREAEVLAAVKAIADEQIPARDLARHPGAFAGSLADAAAVADLLWTGCEPEHQLLAIALLAATCAHAGERLGMVAATIACIATSVRDQYGDDTLEARTAARGAEAWMRVTLQPEDLIRWLGIEAPATPAHDDLLALLAARMLTGVAGDVPPLLRKGRVLVVEAPGADWARPLASAALVLAGRQTLVDGDVVRSPSRRLVTFIRDGSRRPDNLRPSTSDDEVVAGTVACGGALLGVSHSRRLLPEALVRAADRTIAVPRPTPEQVSAALLARDGRMPKEPFPPGMCAALTATDIQLACRAGEDGDAVIQRLRDLATARAQAPRGPTLEGLHGMDDARDWGVALACDLELYRQGAISWTEVDPGCLLVGPPGTGKSRFAARLAAHCRVPLITASHAEWQSAGDGHLGTFLAAMRATFTKAAGLSPCILFIDEVEAFGDRAKFDNYHAQYSTAVVDALLELLAGVEDRPGIVVVGATNHPESLDPALRRSGRLDQTIYVPLPDVPALAAILRGTLGGDLADEDLSDVVELAFGSTGADCERWVRGARRRARNEGRSVTVADLQVEIAGADFQPLSAEELQRAAVHEAGHALVALLGDPPITVHGISVGRHGGARGRTEMDGGPTSTWTRSRWLAEVRACVAGRAAEQVVLGAISGGSGGSPGSDLHRATALVLMMETTTGLGVDGHLTWMDLPDRTNGELLAGNPALAVRVEAVLADAYAEALALMKTHRALLGRLVQRLLRKRKLDGKELLALVRQHRGPVRLPRRTGDRS